MTDSDDPSPDRMTRLASLASAQAGMVTRAQARELGLKDHHLRYRIECGTLVRVDDGLYRFTAVPVDRRQDLMRALLLCGDTSALSHRTAAMCHGTRQFSGELIEVTTAARTRREPEGVVIHRSRRLPPAHLKVLDGLRTTTPARTLVDLAAVQPASRVGRVLEEWLADRKVTVPALRQVLVDLGTRGRADARLVRDLLDGRVLGTQPGDSTDDALLGQLLADRGLPAAVHNHLVLIDGEVLELDWAYPAELLAVEINGFSVHTRSQRNYERELLKRRLVARTPWLLLEYTARMLREQPDRVLDEVESHRRARARTSIPGGT